MRPSRISAMALAAGMLIAAPASAQSTGYYKSGEQPNSQQQWEREEMRRRQMQQEQRGVASSPDRSPAREMYREDQYRDPNPYGVGRDVQDDKWDTGLWDMGEYDVPRSPQGSFDERTREWMGPDEDDRNPFGIGDDVFDDKWDTGLGDMGEYNAWDYPQEYRRDLQALKEGRFHLRYGVPPERVISRQGLRDDDVWSGDQPWYRDIDERTGFRDERGRGVVPWGGPEDRDMTARRDRVRVPLGTTEDPDRRGRRLRLGEATEDRNPFGVGEDIFDDKWDTGAWDMGEYNAWDYPQEYQRDVQLLDRGEFHRPYGVSPDQDTRRSREGLRDDDIWDGRQPWYRDNDRTLRLREW